MSKIEPDKRKPGEKKPGKYHYNPVNMSKKKAELVEKHAAESDASDEDRGNTARPGRRPAGGKE